MDSNKNASRKSIYQKRLHELQDERQKLGQQKLHEVGEPDHDVESTAVIHIRQHFDELLGESHSMSSSSRLFPQSLSLRKQNEYLDESVYSHLYESDASHIPAKRQCLDMEVELISKRGRITELESELNSLKSSRQRAHIDCETQLNALKRNLESEQLKVSGLHAECKAACDREKEKEEELTELQSKYQQTVSDLKQELASVSRLKISLQGELEETRRDLAEQHKNFNNEILKLKETLQTERCDYAAATEELKIASQKALNCDEMRLELEEKKVELSNSVQYAHELELKLSRLDEESKLSKERQQKLARLVELEKENKRLSEENQYLSAIQDNNLLLKEENVSLHTRLSSVENKCRQMTALEIELQDLQKQLTEWQSFTRTIAEGLRTPESVRRHLSDLQLSNQLLLDKNGHLDGSCQLLRKNLNEIMEDNRNLKSKNAENKLKLEESAEFIRKLQRKLSLIYKENKGFKDIIESYEGEITMTADTRTSQRLKQMEESLQSHKSHISYLEKELETSSALVAKYRRLEAKNEFPGQCKSSQSEAANRSSMGYNTGSTSAASAVDLDISRKIDDTDKKLVIQLRSSIADLEARLVQAEREKEEYGSRLERLELQGGYDKSNVRVFHLQDNPFSQAQRKLSVELTTCKEENRKLIAKLKLLEESGNTGEKSGGLALLQDLSTLADDQCKAAASKELEEAKNQLQSAELKNKRLMEEFKRASQELREVTYELLGYRVDILSTHHYKLMNMYAESANEYFLFKRSTSGTMEMLDSPGASQFVDKMETYLGCGSGDTSNIRSDTGSIPAFLCSVTMELFNRRTMMCSNSSVA